MKIDKAIEILKLHRELNLVDKNPDLRDAIKLGIEALKCVNDWRGCNSRFAETELPGEDP